MNAFSYRLRDVGPAWAIAVVLACASAGCDKGDSKASDASAGADAGSDGVGDGAGAADAAAETTPIKSTLSLLLFSKTAGFRHDSIDAAVAALSAAATAKGWSVSHSEDAAVFAADKLEGVDVVAFVHTTGDILDAGQQGAFEAFIQGGGGFVGVHAAADTEYDWPFYQGLVGAAFKDHTSAGTKGTALVLDRVHPATQHLPARWARDEEWYAFKDNPRGKVHVLATVQDGVMGHDHPHAWCQPYKGGRSFYTAGGHAKEAWADKALVDHVVGGIAWAGGAAKGDCAATIAGRFSAKALATKLKEPMELDVAADGTVYFIEKAGKLHAWSPASGKTTQIGALDVDTAHEDGLLGLALAPDFATSRQLYLYHGVKSPKVNRLSRYTLSADGKLDAKSQKTLLDVPVQRDVCCHSSGSLSFGPDGMLYLTVGDNTNPWEQKGYAPVDERKGREHFDAQGTSANSKDLRGKILRIVPKADGSYDSPKGNLFASDADGRREIYVMGARNAFRAAVDAKTGQLWWAETGPDAKTDDPARGPMGYDELNTTQSAGNFGWPYCIANNQAYGDWDFASDKSKGSYDCKAPSNDSPNNSGAKTLPPAQPALVWYPYGDSKEFPAIKSGKGRTALMGTLYRPRGGAADLPAYYDGAAIFMDWTRGWMKDVRLDDDGGVLAIVDFAVGVTFLSPIDVAIGPDGALYVLEYGQGWGENEFARLVRLDYQKP